MKDELEKDVEHQGLAACPLIQDQETPRFLLHYDPKNR